MDNSDTIDFDTASVAWRANKIVMGGGWFAYRCAYVHSNGQQCKKEVGGNGGKPRSLCEPIVFVVRGNPSKFCKQHKIRGALRAGFDET